MKKVGKLLSILLVVLCLLLASGCTKDKEPASTGGTEQNAGGTEQKALSGELNVALAADIAPDSVTEWTKMFKKDYPDVKLNVLLQDASDYSALLQPLVAAGELPSVLGIGCTDWFSTLADKGLLLDVSHTPGWKAQNDVLKKMYTSRNGVKFAVANGVETELLFYNIDHFNQAGIDKVPENWNEFLDCCKKLKDAGFQPLAAAGASPNNMGHSFISFGIAHEIVASGYDPEWNVKALKGEYDFSTPEWQRVLEKTVILRDAGYFQRGLRVGRSIRVHARCYRRRSIHDLSGLLSNRQSNCGRWRKHRHYHHPLERPGKRAGGHYYRRRWLCHGKKQQG